MKAQPEISNPTVECPQPRHWGCYDAQTAEVEVLEFLAQLVRTVKPKLVVETGTNRGISSCYMARSLKANGRGRLITCEVDHKVFDKAVELAKKLGVDDIIDFRLESSLDTVVEEPIDILFTDSLLDLRVKEIRKFWPQLSTRSLIVIHDVNSGCHKALRDEVLALDEAHELSVVMLPTPRGLAIAQIREGRK